MSAAVKIYDPSDSADAADSTDQSPPIPLESTPIPDSSHPLIFDPVAHHYTHAGRKMKGVSSLISQFKRPFDAEYWSDYKAKKGGVDKQQILDEWAVKRDAACDLGHAVHEFAESIANETEEPSPDGLEGYCSGVINAYRDLRIKPIEAEKPVCEPSIGIAGTVDLICRSMTDYCYSLPTILDWKTNKTIDMHNDYGDTMLPPLSHLDDCNFNHYSLQLNLYRFILARRYDFHAERMVLVWLPGDSTYQTIEVPRMDAEVALMLSAWQRSK